MSEVSVTTARVSDYPIDEDILSRWSPRSFDASDLTDGERNSLFEAARWAPSAHNYQPWRFAWSQRNDEYWQQFTELLSPSNAVWATQASALVIVFSDRLLDLPARGDPTLAQSASFDTGAAWALLALQAIKVGLCTRAMGGFDRARAEALFGKEDRYKAEIAVAIGRRGDPANLPEQLRDRERPNTRVRIDDLSFHGPLR